MPFGGRRSGGSLAPAFKTKTAHAAHEPFPMQMACADCDCVVEDGVRVETCGDPDCCCAHIPEAEAETEEAEGA